MAPPLGFELLRLMLELVQGQVDRRVEVVRLLLGEHGDVIGLQRDLGDDYKPIGSGNFWE